MRKIGINLHSVPGLSDEEYITRIADLGFNCTFTGVFEKARHTQIAELAAAHGIEYETVHCPFDRINHIWLDDDQGENALFDLTNTVDCCVAAGAPIAIIHLSSGRKPPSITDIGRARFARLVDHAVKNNVTLAFENQRMLGNISWVFEEFADCENVKFCWDCGHEYCFTPGRHYMPLFGDKLVCTHIHDNPCQFNKDHHMIPFDGKIDYSVVADTIRSSGYTGSIMLEVFSTSSPNYPDITADQFLSRAHSAVTRLVNMIDNE